MLCLNIAFYEIDSEQAKMRTTFVVSTEHMEALRLDQVLKLSSKDFFQHRRSFIISY